MAGAPTGDPRGKCGFEYHGNKKASPIWARPELIGTGAAAGVHRVRGLPIANSAAVLAVVFALPFPGERLDRTLHRDTFAMIGSALPRCFLARRYFCPCLCNLASQPFILFPFGCFCDGCINYYFFLAAFLLAGLLLVAFFFVAFFFVALRFATFFFAAFFLVAFFFVALRFATFFFAAFFLVAFFLVALRFATFLFATFFFVAFLFVAFFLPTFFFAVLFFRLTDFFLEAFFFAFAITKAPLKDLVGIKTQHHVCLYTSQPSDVQSIMVE
jgi:hypothetical protein